MIVGWCLVIVVSIVLMLSVRLVCSGMLMNLSCVNFVDSLYIMKFGIGVSIFVFGCVYVIEIMLMILLELLLSSML